MFEHVAPDTADSDNLIRLDPADAPELGGPGQSLHLIDATMMFAPRSGGVKRYLLTKREWLERRRPDITHTLVVPGRQTGLEAPGLVTVAAAKLPFGDGYRMPASLTKWETVIRMLEPDIIEAGDIFVPGHASLEAGEALGVPVVGFCHTDAAALAALHFGEWAEGVAMKRWASIYERFDRVVAPSAHMAQRLADAGVGDVAVQPLGVDLENFHPSRADKQRLRRRLGVPADTRLLVFAGRPAREKNIESMVCAVERLGDPYRLVLIGAGKDVRYSPHVICLDYERDPAKLAGLVASCDAFLHANENEPFGLVVLEALAAGLPVVGPSRGGASELFDDSVGQRARTCDPEGLAEAIEALFARDLWALSAAARRRAEQRHGWDTTFEGLTRIYAELLAGSRRSPMAMSA
ncbi:glycosyltransferase [Phenylobacterium sp.]|uniref:glycosyltransferase n=1 Tax=Phenylobacterium sp. TaxID=1871053 RepID=UPI002E2FE88F|nr:glycosyltransferase [Phenylobacterium sp.]HEX2561574.1 glycosyltransferase [Phenylobacterium sp.]